MALSNDIVRKYAVDLRTWAAQVAEQRQQAFSLDGKVADALFGVQQEMDAAARRLFLIIHTRGEENDK